MPCLCFAVISLMTAACIAALPEETRIVSAGALALLTGVILIGAGLLKMGFVMNFVSRPVVSAYITGAALLIIFSQMKHILGVSVSSQTAYGMIKDLISQIGAARGLAVLTGFVAIIAFASAKTILPFMPSQIWKLNMALPLLETCQRVCQALPFPIFHLRVMKCS